MALDGLTNMLMHTATKPPLFEPSAKLSKKNDFNANKYHHPRSSYYFFAVSSIFLNFAM